MKKRNKVSSKGSKKLFTKTAKRVNMKNTLGSTVMRGGIRL